MERLIIKKTDYLIKSNIYYTLYIIHKDHMFKILIVTGKNKNLKTDFLIDNYDKFIKSCKPVFKIYDTLELSPNIMLVIDHIK